MCNLQVEMLHYILLEKRKQNATVATTATVNKVENGKENPCLLHMNRTQN